MRSPRIFFLDDGDGATVLEAAEIVGAMKLLAMLPQPVPTLERTTLCALAAPAASRESFSFSTHKGRGKERPLFLQTEELLYGESAKRIAGKICKIQRRNRRKGIRDKSTAKGERIAARMEFGLAGVGAPPEPAARPRWHARGWGWCGRGMWGPSARL